MGGGRGDEHFEIDQSATTTTFCHHQCEFFKSQILFADVSERIHTHTHPNPIRMKPKCNLQTMFKNHQYTNQRNRIRRQSQKLQNIIRNNATAILNALNG